MPAAITSRLISRVAVFTSVNLMKTVSSRVSLVICHAAGRFKHLRAIANMIGYWAKGKILVFLVFDHPKSEHGVGAACLVLVTVVCLVSLRFPCLDFLLPVQTHYTQ